MRVAAPIGMDISIEAMRHISVCLISPIKAPRRRYKTETVAMEETRLDRSRYSSTSLSVIGMEAIMDRVVRRVASLNLSISLSIGRYSCTISILRFIGLDDICITV